MTDLTLKGTLKITNINELGEREVLSIFTDISLFEARERLLNLPPEIEATFTPYPIKL